MISLKGDKSEVLRYLGYKTGKIDGELSRQIDFLIDEGIKIASPKFTYAVFDVKKTENAIMLKNTDLMLTGKDIFTHLENAKKCAVMAVTIGAKFDGEIIKYEKSGEMTKALILDCVGTALAEETADICNKKIVEEAEKSGFYCSYRFSPGYGDLPLETQKQVVPALNLARAIGVTLSDTCLMSPRKSVTAFVGFFREKQKNEKLSCENCSMKETCEKRKKGEKCGI